MEKSEQGRRGHGVEDRHAGAMLLTPTRLIPAPHVRRQPYLSTPRRDPLRTFTTVVLPAGRKIDHGCLAAVCSAQFFCFCTRKENRYSKISQNNCLERTKFRTIRGRFMQLRLSRRRSPGNHSSSRQLREMALP